MIQGEALEQELAEFRAAHPARRLTHRGDDWRYYAAGQGGEAVLLLGGALGLAEFAFQQIRLLEPHFRVLAPDYPPVASLAELAGGLLSLLDTEHIRSARRALEGRHSEPRSAPGGVRRRGRLLPGRPHRLARAGPRRRGR